MKKYLLPLSWIHLFYSNAIAFFRSHRKTSFSLVALSALLLGQSAQAATGNWSATSGLWSAGGAGGNWSGSAAPGATSGTTSVDVAQFTSSGDGTVTVDANRNIKTINFNGTSSYTLSGGNLLLTGGGNITMTGAASETISTGISLEGTFTVSNNGTSTNTLTLGTVTNASGAAVTMNLNGTNTATNSVGGITDGSFSTAITLGGSASWNLTGANNYSGATSVSTGVLTLAGSQAGSTVTTLSSTGKLNVNSTTGLGSGNLNLNGGTLDNTSGAAITTPTNNPAITLNGPLFTFSTAAGTANNNLNLGTGAVSFGANSAMNMAGVGTTLAFGGKLTNTAGAAKTFTINGAGNTVSFGALDISSSGATINDTFSGGANINFVGTIANGGATTGGLTDNTTGTMTLSGSNTFTGALTVNAGGTLTIDYAGAAGGTSTDYGLNNAVAVTLGNSSLEFRGKTGGGNTTNQTITSITTTASSALNTFTVNKNGGGATTVTVNTMTRGSGSVLLYDLSSGGAISTTKANAASGIFDIGFLVKDNTGRIDFASNSGNTVQALGAANETALPTGGGGATVTNYALSGSQTQTGSTSTTPATNTLRLNSTGAGQSLNLATFNLGATVLFVGSDDYSILGSGTMGTSNSTSNAGTAIFQFGTGKLTIGTKMGFGNGNNIFVGTGSNLIDWNSTSSQTPTTSTTGETVFSNLTLRLSNSGAINLTTTGSNAIGTGFVIMGGGAVLELASGDLTRNIASTAAGGAIGMIGSSAGFSAFGADRAVNLSSGAALTWASTAGFLADGATLILGSSFSTNTLDFQNSINLGTLSRTVEVRDGTSSTNVDGKLSGGISSTGGGLIKTGAGTLLLTNTNTYTGVTTVSAGKLIVGGSLTATSSVSVASTANLTLAGSGLINTSITTTVNPGGTLAGQGALGALSVSGTLTPGVTGTLGTLTAAATTLAANSAFNIKLGTPGATQGSASNNDLLAATSLTLPTGGSTIALNITNFNNADSTSGSLGEGWYKIATFTGGALAAGDATSFTINGPGGFTYSIAIGSSEVDLHLVAIPEPGTWAMLIGGFGILGFWQRSRKRFGK